MIHGGKHAETHIIVFKGEHQIVVHHIMPLMVYMKSILINHSIGFKR